jgi:hypothetical protein
MELKNFISETLVEIQTGVQDAISQLVALDAKGAVNPVFREVGRAHIQTVEFDIAVTVADKTAGAGKAGIQVIGLGVGGKVETQVETSHISRIRFSIPLIPPTTTVRDS